MILSNRKQKGNVTVEFAITGVVFFMILLGVLEVGRALFVWNVLEEVVRRGARVAAVCQVDDTGVENIALFNDGAGNFLLPNFTTNNIKITYLKADGTEADTVTESDQIMFVKAEIENFTHELLVPFVTWEINPSGMNVILYRESLGIARPGATPTGFSTC